MRKLHNRDADSRQAVDDRIVAAFSKLDRQLDRKAKRRFAPIGNAVSIQRLSNIQRYLAWAYGSVLPDDDGGSDDLRILVAAAKAAGKPAIDFVRKWAPWMLTVDANRLIVNVNVREAYISADAIAARLGVTYAIRQDLHLRSIGSIDVDKAGRERRQRKAYK